jgi:FlaA1/EpsC-like NDP-sugar epimerase
MMVEQSEGALFLIEQELNELGLGSVAVPLVADILDTARMNYIFSRYEPEIIFHAAAHKHVYMMERQPSEAIRNNAFGTRQLAQIAAAHGADAFVLISTDKAINPTNVMGATKRLAELQLMSVATSATERGVVIAEQRPASTEQEQRTVGFQVIAERAAPGAAALSGSARKPHPLSMVVQPSAHQRATKFMAVRFGNVLGSSGSVIPIFKRQIANGGPVTVTHPDVTRYFMTIPEAVGLVLQSFVLGNGGEIFVLDMGQPVKIVDLARQMIELSGFRVGEDIEIKFTGLKPGEKLFEELQHHTEDYAPTSHPRIMQFKSRAHTSGLALSGEGYREAIKVLEEQLHQLDPNQLKIALKRLVPEYTPFLD